MATPKTDPPVLLARLQSKNQSDRRLDSFAEPNNYDEYEASQPLILRDSIDDGNGPVPPPSRKRRGRTFRGSRTQAAIYVTSTFILFLVGFFFAPSTRHSSSNDLLFVLAKPGSPLRSYPVGLTAGVIPKRFHSHNDYEQNTPLFKALSYGASSIEADIWLVNNELLVGHDTSELSPERTLSSLYLEPLISLIQAANSDANEQAEPLRGVFETAPKLSLQLLIDIKTDGPTTFTRLYSELSHLRDAGYLTTLTANMSSVRTSAITVIGTGNTPLENVLALGNSSAPRDIFLDAPLADLPDDESVYSGTVSPLASVDFGSTVGWTWMFPAIGRRRIRRLVDAAHARGIQARFWNSLIAPTWARNFVWQMLLDEGVDWLNVDDLPSAKVF